MILHRTIFRGIVVFSLAGLISGCVLAPREAKNEQAALRRAGKGYEQPFAKRDLPELPAQPDWRDVLHRALLANGELEAAYFEWAAAVARIQRAGGYPNTPLSLGFNYTISGGNMKAFDRATFTAGPDAMENLAFPTKIYQAAKVALDDARAAGRRFAAVKFDIQRRALNAWIDYALLAESIRVQRENLTLLKLVSDTAANRVQAGGRQQDLLKAEIEYRLAGNELQSMEAELPQQRARLNAMMLRDPDAMLPPPMAIPAARPVPADDAELLILAVDNNPELAALAKTVAGREDALELARMQYIPDFNPFAGFTGTASQFIGLGISIPTLLPEIRGMVSEARADLRRVRAMYRQTKFDRAASVVAALYALRDSERKAELFEDQILPMTQRLLADARRAYSADTGSFLDLIDSQRTLLNVRLILIETRAAREKSLADLEALLGVDIETLATVPDTRPSTWISIQSAATTPAQADMETPHEQQ